MDSVSNLTVERISQTWTSIYSHRRMLIQSQLNEEWECL